jgi:N-acetylglucosaminyldiphosphoundecaprenol N-acetyl-beta-D-mannosaminyltransferase
VGMRFLFLRQYFSMVDIQRIRVLDAPVDVINMETALAFVDDRVAAGRPGNYVLAMNPEKTFALRRDRRLGEFFEDAALLLPDGIGVVLAARFLHGARIGRVPGADLMQEICRHAAAKGHRIFIYGASEEVSAAAVLELKRRYPGIRIVGRANGYVAAEAMEALVDEINDSQADILFVALGSPRQENWMRQYGPGLKVPLCLGIGGTLDTIVGKVRRAPKLFQRLGLEWLYRLAREPSRAARQKVLPLFAWQVLVQRLWRSGRLRG